MRGSSSSPPLDLVVLGGGHSHVEVLRQFGQRPEPGVRLTLVSRDVQSPYSGMLPGYVAGHYHYDQVHIDLPRLARFAGARFVQAEAIGLDRERQRLICQDRVVPFDRLSINIGSTPQLRAPGAREHAVPVKPIDLFNQRWLALLDRARVRSGPLHLAVVGGGAGGVELILAMQYRLRRERSRQGFDPDALAFSMFTASPVLLPTHSGRVRDFFLRKLTERGISVHLNQRVERVEKGALLTADDQRFSVDEVIWVTQAGGAPWLAEAGLAVDSNGFIQVNDCLQTLSDPSIFAAGDIAQMVNHPREKAGVFAVRQGWPLSQNLRRSLGGRALKPFRPQQKWLALISTGDRFAVASRGRFSVRGRWVWSWKDWIDRRFMRRFRL